MPDAAGNKKTRFTAATQNRFASDAKAMAHRKTQELQTRPGRVPMDVILKITWDAKRAPFQWVPWGASDSDIGSEAVPSRTAAYYATATPRATTHSHYYLQDYIVLARAAAA